MFTGSIQKTEPNKSKGGVQQFLSLLLLPVFALTIFAGKASAQIDGDLDADIPFQFHVGNKELGRIGHYLAWIERHLTSLRHLRSPSAAHVRP